MASPTDSRAQRVSLYRRIERTLVLSEDETRELRQALGISFPEDVVERRVFELGGHPFRFAPNAGRRVRC